MKNFFLKMFSNGDDVSSKRFSAFFTLLNIIILAYVATFMSAEKVTPEFMFDALALIAGGGLGLTVIEKIFTKKEKSEAAPTIGGDIKTTTCACGDPSGSCGKCNAENNK